MQIDSSQSLPRSHPRTLGWIGTTALAMGGSNQSLFLITALFVGQGDIPGQGSAAVLLLIAGVLLSWAAAPAWTELILMWPNRVGGIAAACSEAFRPYSPVLSALTGTCYWWGWVPTCGLTALLSAAAIQQWFFPEVPVQVIAIAIVVGFTSVNLCGIKWVTRLAIPVATGSAALALLASLIPVFSGHVDWHRAADFTLTSPFPGWFGNLTSIMAGLYLVGFAAPAFEAATCHVGETIDPNRNVPRALLASGGIAGLYFVVLPLVWLGALGPGPLGGDLTAALGPVFAPLFGGLGKAAAIWFIMLNMFHGTMQPLAGAARTLSQLSEDGLLPRFLALRSRTDSPWAATLLTASMAILFLSIGDPIWLIAAANFTYLIGICMPNVATLLLRRDLPGAERPYRAPRFTVGLGVIASIGWLVAAVLGFQQFGLPTVIAGLAMAYSGAGLYTWRVIEDRRKAGLPLVVQTLHVKLTGAMLAVLVLDGAGYFIAVNAISTEQAPALVAALEDIFVIVALLTITVGLVLPGMIAHSAGEVGNAAKRLTSGTLRDFSNAMEALGRGDLDSAYATVNIEPVRIHSKDELGELATSFNLLQGEVKKAAVGLDNAREGIRSARSALVASHADVAFLALHDSLTNLPNRRALASRLDETIARAAANGTTFAVLCIDLDNFKETNDFFGHAVGDELLRAFAERLRTLAGDTFVSRIGGDEFTLISELGEQPATATALSARLLKAALEFHNIGGLDLRIGLSIGVAIYPKDGNDPIKLLGNADAALYRAKADGRFQAVFFEAAMDGPLQIKRSLQHDLRSAIPRDELVLYYQPQARITGEIFGFEALVRWQHEKLGFLLPDTFIHLAEQEGTIVEIGEWVLRKACSEAASWAAPLQIAVNISPIQFRHGDLAELVHRILVETGLGPERLELEITEGVIMNDKSRTVSVLRRIKALGVKIAMDDFGTGYSSLAALHAFPFDTIKIDRTFIAGLESDDQSAAILHAIIGLGSTLGMRVIAEGVETEAQQAFLASEGCDEMQGYLIGRPFPITRYEALTSGFVAENSRNSQAE